MRIVSDMTGTTYELSATAAKSRDKLSKQIAAHNDDVQAVETDAAKVRDTTPTAWGPQAEKAAAGVRSRRRELLVREIALRQELTKYYDHVDTVERPAAHDKAVQSHQKLFDSVSAQLIAIGYIQHKDGTDILSPIVLVHPGVRDAQVAVDTIRVASTSDFRQANDKALADCQAALEEFKSTVLSALAA